METTLQDFNKKIESLNVSLEDYENLLSKSDEKINKDEFSKQVKKKLFDVYYKIKHDYDNKYQLMKEKILHDDSLTLKQKKDKFKKIKKKCIKCGNDGGTIFSNKDGILKAMCGSNSNPCKLNIEIEKGNNFLLLGSDEGIDSIDNDINEIKESIIIEKLNLLFQYSNENEVLKNFNALKKELNEMINIKISNLNEINELINNKEKKIEIKNIYLSNELLIKNMKELLKQFEEKPNIQLIKDIILLYKNNLIKGLKKINNLKYALMEVDYNEETNIYTLVQKKYTLQNLEVSV